MSHLSSLLTIALAAGLARGVFVEVPAALAIALTMSAGWATALLAYLRGFARVQIAAMAALVFGAGWVLGAHALAAALHPPLRAAVEQWGAGEPLLVEGRLREDALVNADGVMLRLDVARIAIDGVFERTTGGVSVSVGGTLQPQHVAQWTAGRVVRAPVTLRRPARYLDAGVPDHERALAQRGVALVGSIKSAALVELVDKGAWWEEAASAARSRVREALRRHVVPYSAQSSAIATAILIGDRAALTPGIEHRLQEAGTYHVIAISGGNIALLAAVWLGALRLAGVRGRAASIAGIAALVAYAAIAVGGASVLRATLMAVIYLAVRAIDHRTAAANAISLAAASVQLLTPLVIADVGFWFTFGATAALLLTGAMSMRSDALPTETPWRRGATLMTSVRATAHAIVRAFSMVLLASACVELALAPIAALVFQRVTVAGLALNAVAIPAMTVVQIGAMTVVALDAASLPQAASWLGQYVHFGAMALTESARLLDVAPWLTWRVPSPQPSVMAGYYAALAIAIAACVRAWRRPVAWMASSVAAILLLWIVAAPAARVRAHGDGTLHLSLLDVGQGDAMLVVFPNGRTLVVDTGASSPDGEFDIGDRVIGPALRVRGLLTVDYLAVTHGDPDHIGGARTLLRDFGANEVWWGVPVPRHEATAALHADAARHRIGWRTLQRGDRLEIGGVEVRVHHPPPPDWERQRVRNNDSVVIELRTGDVSMLLTGDIGKEVEQDLLASLDLLPITILKVAHHGSATSSSAPFLAHVRPRIALIGVGRHNPYGHPLPAVLGRLHDIGAEVFRTDLDGQVEVNTDGQVVEVKTFTGRSTRIESQAREAAR